MAATKTARRRKAPRDPYQQVTDRILAELEQGTVPWKKPWAALSGVPALSLATGKPYRGINWMLTSMAGYESPWWLTYNQAAERGAQVRKGEHGTPVFLWKTAKIRLNTAEKRRRAEQDGLKIRRDAKGEYAEAFMARTYTVFNASQVDGLDPKLTPTALADSGPEWSQIDRCEQVLKSYEGGPKILMGGTRAAYNLRTDLVRMPDQARFQQAGDWYATLFHELAHSTGHPNRLNRPTAQTPGDHRAYAREELVAELAAAMLCAQAGIDSAPLVEQAAAYIESWQRSLKADNRLIVIAAQRAAKAADHILGQQTDPAEEA